jgi:GDPmannose 4,6-dehydratase
MKAIITGVTGMDGSHLSDLLLQKGYDVVGVTRYASTDSTERIKHLLDHPKFTLESGDITDVSSITNILNKHGHGFQVEFYNLAAQSHVGESFKNPSSTWDVTGKSVLDILQAIVDLDMKHIRFYQASSSEMFGKNYDESNGIKYQDEKTAFLPQSPYAIAKCAAHYTVRLFREAYGLHASCGILFNHEGPRRGDKFVTRKITKWIGELLEWGNQFDNYVTPEDGEYIAGSNYDSQKVLRFPKLRLGNLEASRDWGYSPDYCEAMFLMLQQKEPDDYVVCTGETHTIRDFLDVAFKEAGIDDWHKYVVIDPQFYRPAEVDYLCGKNTKAKEKLGWQPKHSFEDLVKEMVDSDTNLKKFSL